MKQIMSKLLSLKSFSTFFLISSLKFISTLKTKNILMKPDTFDFKSLPDFMLQL